MKEASPGTQSPNSVLGGFANGSALLAGTCSIVEAKAPVLPRQQTFQASENIYLVYMETDGAVDVHIRCFSGTKLPY